MACLGSDDPEVLRRALSELQGLGARPTEAIFSHRLRAILRKLDVQTRGEASAQAVKLGLGQPG